MTTLKNLFPLRANPLNLKALTFTLIATLALFIPALAQSGNPPAPEPVILTDEQGEYPLGLHLEILEDPGGELTIEDVSSPEYDSQFVPSQAEVPNYGFTESAYWVRLRLDNQTHQTDEWLLEVDFANMHYVDLYTPLPDGEGFDVKQTGVLRPVSTRDVLDPHIVLDLLVPTQSQQTIYLRFQNGASMTLPLTLWTRDAFFIKSQREQTLHWLFFGALFALLVYHLILLFSLREASYLYFVILLASLILEELSYEGYLEAYFIPNLYSIRQYYYPLFFALLMTAIVLFSDTFLELRTRLPKLHWVNIVFLAGWGALMLLTPFTSYHIIANLMAPWAVFSLLTALATGIITWRQGFKLARFFMIAWFGLLASIIMVLLVRFVIIPSTFFSENFYKVGMIWMAVCWSIALADRINLLKAETESANRDLQASEARYRQLVETMNDGLGVRDEHGRFTYLNNRLAEMLGYRAEELIGHLATEFVDENNQQRMLSQWEQRKTGISAPYELTWRKKDGGELITLVSPVPLFENGGRYQGSFAVVTDITERVLAGRVLEQRVIERTQELSTLLEISRDISVSQDITLVLDRILERLKTVVDYHGLVIFAEEKGKWRILAQDCPSLSAGPDSIELSSSEVKAIKKDFAQGGAIMIQNFDLNAANVSGFGTIAARLAGGCIPNINCWLGVPLFEKGSIFGAMVLGCEQPGASEDQIKVIVASANQVAIAIENNRLYQQIRESVMSEERGRLARDLHDSVTQVLFSATLLAEVLPQIWRRDPELGLQKLDKLRQLTHGALAEMRAMLLELRPAAVINTPLSDLLAQLAASVTSRSGLPFQLFIEQIPPLPENVHINFYRIAQEALNNVVKHAQANRVTMSLSATPLAPDSPGGARHEVKLVIQDDGVGYSAEDRGSEHMGIGIMRDRAAAIQASLSLESQPGYGTQVTLIWYGETGRGS